MFIIHIEIFLEISQLVRYGILTGDIKSVIPFDDPGDVHDTIILEDGFPSTDNLRNA